MQKTMNWTWSVVSSMGDTVHQPPLHDPTNSMNPNRSMNPTTSTNHLDEVHQRDHVYESNHLHQRGIRCDSLDLLHHYQLTGPYLVVIQQGASLCAASTA